MLTSFGSGEIWKGSNQEISVVLVPRCYKVEGEITDVVLNFYTTAGGTSIEFSGDTVTVSGINATVVFQPVQLDALDDGLIRYNVAFNEGGESHVFDLETRYMLKTPNDYEPVDYVTHDEVEGVVDELLVEKLEDYYTSGETNEAISNAMAAETARTESTYLKEHQSLADYWTSAQTESAITTAIEAQSATTSAQTEELISQAMAAETARTEQTYLKEYNLPAATTTTLGGVKVGSGLTVDSGGTLSTEGGGSAIKLIDFDTLSQTELVALYTELMTAFSGVTKPDTSGYRFMRTISNNNKHGSMEMYISEINNNEIFFDNVTSIGKAWFLYGFKLKSDGTLQATSLNKIPTENFYQRKLTAGTGIEITNDYTINCTVTGGTVPVATTGSTGVVQVGSGLTIDSAGTLNNGVISVFIDEKQGSQQYYKEIYDFVRANSGDTSLVIYYANANLDRWYECLWYQCNENHFIFTFYDFDGARIVSNIISNNGSYGNNRTDNLVMKPNSSEYSPFNKKLHLSSGGTLYFDDIEVDSGGTYDGILNIWGMLILVGAYQFINTHTGPFDTMLCPLYVDSSSTDSGRTLMYPKVIDEPANVSIPGKEIADHKVTLVYDEYKISWYQRGSQDWITGLSVTPNGGTVPIATTASTGVVQVGSGLTIDNDGVLSVSGGTDLSDYWTSAQTQSAITDAISGIDLGDYYTSAQTDNKIAEAVSAVTFSGVTQPILDATMAAETARTEQTYLKQGALADYYTSGETNEVISNAIAAETARTESTYLKEHQSLDNYYTKAQTDSAITNAIDTESARTNTAIANAIAAETARTEQTYLKQGALAGYYTSGQTNTAISNAVSEKVSSSTITQIWTGSQQAYDAMTEHSANILYIINS